MTSLRPPILISGPDVPDVNDDDIPIERPLVFVIRTGVSNVPVVFRAVFLSFIQYSIIMRSEAIWGTQMVKI